MTASNPSHPLGWPDGHAESRTGHPHPEALPIQWSPAIEDEMFAICAEAYPGEGCGFLLGIEVEGVRHLTCVVPIDNVASGPDMLRRFTMSPLDFLKAERTAAKEGLLLLGVFHSHPDHLPVPSRHDLHGAMPTLSYPILALAGQGRPKPILAGIRSWQLNDHRQFAEETLQHS